MLAKLGHVKMVLHRPITGKPKTAIAKRTPTGKWYVSISVEIAEEEIENLRLPACSEVVGIDVGLHSSAYLSTGEEIANPRFFRREEAALARASRKLLKVASSERKSAKSWRACMSGSEIVAKTSLNERWPRCSNGSGCWR